MGVVTAVVAVFVVDDGGVIAVNGTVAVRIGVGIATAVA